MAAAGSRANVGDHRITMALPSDVELVETLGEGSFGVVYVARLKDGAIERTVVLKVLLT